MLSPFLKKKKSSERLPEQDLSEQSASYDLPEDALTLLDTPDSGEESSSSIFAKKSPMDKKSLDLVFAVEQMIQAKQGIEASNYEMQDRLNYANGHIDRLNKDLKNLNKVIEDREKSIMELEQKLTEKNLKVDQMMDDYRELQSVLSDEIEELKGANEVERQKYASLLQKNNETQAEKNKRIGELEEKIGKLEVEHTHMKQKFETLRQEKAYLVNMVNDFTARMTSPFSPTASANDGIATE
ncbi:hypothetical protein [Cohnella nanjingensis]|uniref:Uncharacterized protein n=1 Tax=Cohnella nanjingensis TaxID=1387779 RepID=A0A7X0VG40_9BACL|nr:hypothetical protein [Cohnella nanjingensis]MBB6671933.1 hypothetical protein [Cohnella nanjingensis]